MPKKRFTFALDPEIGFDKLNAVAEDLKRSKSNSLEILIEEAERKIKIKKRKKDEA
jgi:hypothetical protein